MALAIVQVTYHGARRELLVKKLEVSYEGSLRNAMKRTLEDIVASLNCD